MVETALLGSRSDEYPRGIIHCSCFQKNSGLFQPDRWYSDTFWLEGKSLSNDQKISFRFQSNYFVVRRGAKTAHSLATQGFEQRSMTAKKSNQIVKLFIDRY